MKRAYCVVCFLIALASFATAQNTGAAIAGAKAEAASDALIKKLRTAITTDEGRYAFIDLSFGLVNNVTEEE